MNHSFARIKADPDRYLLNFQDKTCFVRADLFCWLLLLMTRGVINQTALSLASLPTQLKYLVKYSEQLVMIYPMIATALLVSALIANHNCRLMVFPQIAPSHCYYDYAAKPYLFQSWVQTAEKSYFCSGVNSMQ
ncbi:MAG: hypothetical protein AAF652_21615 [Cyanobacteria bacterium P01_C01_bin.72]